MEKFYASLITVREITTKSVFKNLSYPRDLLVQRRILIGLQTNLTKKYQLKCKTPQIALRGLAL
jgi:hypothetical protein